MSKLTERDIPAIRERIAAGESNAEIGDIFGVVPATIWAIKIGRTWNWV